MVGKDHYQEVGRRLPALVERSPARKMRYWLSILRIVLVPTLELRQASICSQCLSGFYKCMEMHEFTDPATSSGQAVIILCASSS